MCTPKEVVIDHSYVLDYYSVGYTKQIPIRYNYASIKAKHKLTYVGDHSTGNITWTNLCKFSVHRYIIYLIIGKGI